MFTRAVSIYDSKQGSANDSNIEVEVNNQSIRPVYTDLLLSHATYFTLQVNRNFLTGNFAEHSAKFCAGNYDQSAPDEFMVKNLASKTKIICIEFPDS